MPSFYDRECNNCRFSAQVPEGHSIRRESWLLCQVMPQVYVKHKRQFCSLHRFPPPTPPTDPGALLQEPDTESGERAELPMEVMVHALSDRKEDG